MLWWIGIALVLSGAGSVWMFHYQQRGPRDPIHAIADAPEGEVVRVRGRVACERAMTAPLTGRACVYYRIEYRCEAGAEITTSADAKQVDFTITDGSGTALVISERGSYEIIADIFETGRASGISATSTAVVRAYGWHVPEIARIEVCEAIVAVDETIDVIGAPTREPEPEPTVPLAEMGYRDALPTRLVFGSGHRVVDKPRERRYIGAR